MRLSLVAFGKLKTPGLAEACAHYRKLLSAWVRCDVVELKPLPVPDRQPASRARIQAEEGARLRARLDQELGPRGRYYLLDERGPTRSTRAWSEEIARWEASSIPAVALCIGSSLGFAEELRKGAHGLLSLGPQTLSHELARAALLEQLYRAWSVTKGHPYHVEG